MGILFFLLVLSTIVAIHEFGHLIVARMCGVHVETFSIGMGPKLVSWRDKRGTLWCISALPLGGYVKMLGHGSKSDVTDENRHRSYGSKTVYQRMAIVAAGPFINFITAAFMFMALALMAGEVERYDIAVRTVDSPAAAAAGVEVGDNLVSINGRSVADARDIYTNIMKGGFGDFDITVERDGTLRTFTGQSALTDNGIDINLGVGLVRKNVQVEEFGFVSSFTHGVSQTADIISLQVTTLKLLITGQVPFNQLQSIIGIGDGVNTSFNQTKDEAVRAAQEAAAQNSPQPSAEASQSADDDVPFGVVAKALFQLFLTQCAFLSVAIGFMNLLPFLPLDGGHLTTYIYEAVARRKMPNWLMNLYGMLGIGLLLAFFLFATFNDVLRIVNR